MSERGRPSLGLLSQTGYDAILMSFRALFGRNDVRRGCVISIQPHGALERSRTFDLPSMFAGKLHALLCRNYLKGRDWYDFIWYTARRTPLNHGLLSAALDQQGPWMGRGLKTDNGWCVEQLRAMIVGHDWAQARRDVQRFVKPHELPSLELRTSEFFRQQCAKLGESGSPR